MVHLLDLQVLDYVAASETYAEIPPTHREIASKLGIKHYSMVSRSLRRLIKAGFLDGDPTLARTTHVPKENRTVFEGTPYHIVNKGKDW